jgi:hypothetical protein
MVGDDSGADMLRLLLHLLHQPGALDDVGKAWIVFHIGGDGELAAGLDALEQDGLEHGAGRIDRRRVAGGSRADNHDLGMGRLAHLKCPRLFGVWRFRHFPGGPGRQAPAFVPVM